MQAPLKLVLEPIFEAEFHPCSYGFRPFKQSVAVTVATTAVAVAAGLRETALPASVLTVLGNIAVNVATNQTRYDYSGSAGNPAAYRYLYRVRRQSVAFPN